MGLVSRSGLKVHGTKGSGKMVKLMDKENFGMQMVMFTMDSGKTIKQTATELMFTLMELDTQGTG